MKDGIKSCYGAVLWCDASAQKTLQCYFGHLESVFLTVKVSLSNIAGRRKLDLVCG